jgi:hypothetical protein
MDQAQTSTASEAPASPAEAIKAQAVDAMSHSEDATALINEMRDQRAEREGDPAVGTPERTKLRNQRYKAALDNLRNENARIRAEASGDVQINAQQSAELTGGSPEAASDGQQDGDFDLERHERLTKAAAQFQVRAKMYADANPDFAAAFDTTFQIYQPAQHITEAIIESEVTPEIFHRMTQVPEAILQLNELPKEQAIRFIDKMEGAILATRNAQASGLRQPNPRRVTKAAAPIKPVTGGANAPKSLEKMAESENATDIINHWRKEKRARGE